MVRKFLCWSSEGENGWEGERVEGLTIYSKDEERRTSRGAERRVRTLVLAMREARTERSKHRGSEATENSHVNTPPSIEGTLTVLAMSAARPPANASLS